MDVLTLTATPIPRTLHMSLIGIRDMGVFWKNHLWIVYRFRLMLWSMMRETVREAIRRSFAVAVRVYYVYNRVNGYCRR